MNILFLAPRLPLPADTGGKIRTLNILKQLARHAKVTLLAFAFEPEDEARAKELNTLGITVHLVPMRDYSTFEKVFNVVVNLKPFSIVKYDSKIMHETVTRLLKESRFNAIHIDHLHMAHYIPTHTKIPCFLDEHNVEYKILKRCIPVEKSIIKKIIFFDQALKMKIFERNRIKSVKACFACSSDDQFILNKLDSHKTAVHVIPNGVDMPFFGQNSSSNEQEDAIVFTGSMDWLPNDDAITYFCDEILPLVWQQNPAIKLYVVGKNPSGAVEKLAQKDKRVIVTGRVDDVRPYVHRSKVFIVPLRIGGGTRLKILEAMAMKKAIVSTSIGAEGIECQDNLNIALADSPQDFARKVIELCQDPGRVAAMGVEGHKLVAQKYDWTIIGDKLNSIYKEAVHAK